VVDILFFRKRTPGEPEGDVMWLDVDEICPSDGDDSPIRVNRWFTRHPAFVLGTHALVPGPYGETYTCQPRPGVDLEQALVATISLLPEAIYDGDPARFDHDAKGSADAHGVGPEGGSAREGSFYIAKNTALMQMVD